MVCSSFTFNVNDLHDFPGLTADECCVYSFISYWLIGFKKKKKDKSCYVGGQHHLWEPLYAYNTNVGVLFGMLHVLC